MPKNKVQFQKGQSMPDFLAQYGTEDQCRNVLFNLRWPEGFVCAVCCQTNYSYIPPGTVPMSSVQSSGINYQWNHL